MSVTRVTSQSRSLLHCTETVTVVVCVTEPDAEFTLTVYVPAGGR
jgi:hypothetical protein